MSQELWNAVDHYITDSLLPPDPILDAALASGEAAGLPPIAVSPAQGKFLHLLARSMRAQNILEIGTLGGYSGLWLARALPANGKLVTLEVDPKHAEVARANFARAGLSDKIELRLAPALETLPKLAAENRAPFDLIFIDADKVNIPVYFTWALKLARPGGVIIIDNVVRKGALSNPADTDPAVQGVRRLHEMLSSETRVSATTLQTVGAKGYDGFTLAFVTAET
jgi:predicted O-methyltransferase YrrM